MPLYEYKCETCGVTFEVIQKFSDPALETCKNCGGKVRRLLSAPAIQFKGSGWYITDYARKNMSGADHDKSSSGPPSSAAADTKPAASSDAGRSAPAAPSTPSGSKN